MNSIEIRTIFWQFPQVGEIACFMLQTKIKLLEKHCYSFYTESLTNKYIKYYNCVKRLKDSLKQQYLCYHTTNL